MKTKSLQTYERELHAKRKSLSLDGEQELCCISLLIREGYEFVLLRPRGIKNENERIIESFFYKIKQIHFNGKTIELEKMIEKEMDEILPCSQLSGLLRNRRYKERKKNVISITNNSLIEILNKIGFIIEMRTTRNPTNVLKMNRIGMIKRDDIGVISKDKVLEIGKELNRRLLIPFQNKGLKRDHHLIVGKEFIEGIFDDIPFKQSEDDINGIERNDQNEKIIAKSDFIKDFDVEDVSIEDENDYEKGIEILDFDENNYKIIDGDFGWFAVNKNDMDESDSM